MDIKGWTQAKELSEGHLAGACTHGLTAHLEGQQAHHIRLRGQSITPTGKMNKVVLSKLRGSITGLGYFLMQCALVSSGTGICGSSISEVASCELTGVVLALFPCFA